MRLVIPGAIACWTIRSWVKLASGRPIRISSAIARNSPPWSCSTSSGLVERRMSTSAPMKRRIVTSISETIRLIVISAARKGQTCRQ